MRFEKKTLMNVALAGIGGITLCLQFGLAQQGGAGAPAAAPNAVPPDPRVQQRTYRFVDTNEDIPYAVFVSSKVSKDKKNPLIIALHGRGSDHNRLMRGNLLDLAEAGGYIVFSPMGYRPRAWYGIPWLVPAAPGATPNEDEPAHVRALSEKDVMNVLEMARKEFNVDENRTYLMGHSMGGAGSIYLGFKYPSNWAAIAAIAPAARRMEENMRPVLSKLRMPVLVISGGRRHGGAGGEHQEVDRCDERNEDEL
jgi:predicted peptidase